MDTEVKETGRFERTLTVRLEESELEGAKAQAAKTMSKQMKIKGFRPGKAPMKIVERMVGADHLRSEAIDVMLPEIVAGAIEEEELDPATTPTVSASRDTDDGGVEIDVVITLWPKLDAIPDFSGRKVEVQPPMVEPEEIDRQIEALRNQFADLEDVDRPAIAGDFVLVNVSVHDGDTEIEDAAANDLLYEVGSRSFIPGLDEVVMGAAVGAIAEGEGTLPEGFTDRGGDTVTLRALVKAVKLKRLPELSDEFIAEVTDFDSEEELRDQLEQSIHGVKVQTARAEFENRAIQEFVADLDLDLPQGLIEAETESRIRRVFESLQNDGIGFEDYLRIIGQDQASFTAGMQAQALSALSTRVLLESIIAIDGLEVDDDEYREAVEALARSAENSVDEIEQLLASSGQKEALTSDILHRKALDRIAAAAEPVDSEGNAVDLTLNAPSSDHEHKDEALAGASHDVEE
ncbi:MAG: trigger factor [Acidimicrobiia bacterium]|nr:MAG: trigger factor [Acidimicrobiia bacterium]